MISRWAMDAFQAVTDTATTMVLVLTSYLLHSLWQIAKGKKHKGQQFLAIGGIIYGIYMLYSSGALNLLYCIGIYALAWSFGCGTAIPIIDQFLPPNEISCFFAIVTGLGLISLIVFLIQLG